MKELLNQSSKFVSRISEIIRTDATYIAKENFLATHTPFTNLEFVKSGIIDTGRTNLSEESFLEQQILQARDEHQFLIVQGHNGSGKSHFIRWIKERYESEVSKDQEATLFISRWQSTLRGALEQITDSDIFKGSQTAEEIKKLIQANEHLSDSNLKRNIIHQFAIAVQDDEGSASLQIPSKDQRNLYAFLVDSEIQEFMFRENGPIERIKLKLAAEASNQRLDVSPRFLPEDFKISDEELDNIKRAKPSRRALKMLENLYFYDESGKLKEQLSAYLNQFIDQVVQKCTNLRGSDLKEVFLRLREELKSQGKSLTLFIEDITSFTGIDRALVEVLVTEHKGNDDEDRFCRIFSIVGITNEYYKNSFPDNLKERITGRVFIDQATFTDGDKIAEMAGRYLNAIYLGEEEIQQWAQSSGLDEKLPIATKFTKQEWSNFELKDGRTLPLFPFNKAALINLFNGLERKTPRMFLKNVLSYVLHIYFSQTPTNQFPPHISDFSKVFPIPSWKDPVGSPRILERKAAKHSNRLASFLRLWGDRTVDTRQVNGEKTVGGLPEVAFKDFGLPFIAGDVKEEVKETPSGDTNNKDDKNKKGYKDPKVEKPPNKHPDPPIVKSKEEQEFEAMQRELEDWVNGGPLSSYRIYRDEMYKAILEFIDWEAEEVEVPFVQHHFKNSMVNFEGQTSRPSIKNFLMIPRDKDSYYALLGLSAYIKLGKKSWDFENANDFIIGLYNWLRKNQELIINLVKYPKEIKDPSTWTLRKWGVLTKYYLQSIAGNIPENASKQQIYNAIMNPNLSIYTEDQTRSKAWTVLQKKLYGANQKLALFNEFFMGFDSCHQGDISNKSKLSYIDAAEILKVIEEFTRVDWDLDYLPTPELEENPESMRMLPFQLLLMIKSYIPEAYNEEKQAINRLVTSLQEFVDTSGNMKKLTNTFMEMKGMLEYLKQFNEPFSSNDFANLENGSLDAGHLADIMGRLSNLDSLSFNIGLIHLAENPLMNLQPYIFTFTKMDQLLVRVSDKYSSKLTKAESLLKEQKTEDIIDATREELKGLQASLTSIHRKEGVDANR
jgi:hypothetical protein